MKRQKLDPELHLLDVLEDTFGDDEFAEFCIPDFRKQFSTECLAGPTIRKENSNLETKLHKTRNAYDLTELTQGQGSCEGKSSTYSEMFSCFPILADHHCDSNTSKNSQGKICCRLESKSLVDHFESPTTPFILITTVLSSFYVIFASQSLCELIGWTCEEIVGLDLSFLEGCITNMTKLHNYLAEVLSTVRHTTHTNMMAYTKDNELLAIKLHATRVIDSTTIIVEFVETQHVDNWDMCGFELPEEIGLVLDRRDGCSVHPCLRQRAPICPYEWYFQHQRMKLDSALIYMMESQAPILLCNR